MKLHLVGLPHTQITREVSACPFTQKIIKFCKMMKPLGYEVILYAGDQNEAECSEFVSLFTTEEQVEWYGERDLNTLPSVATWNSGDPSWINLNHRAINEIGKRLGPLDLILVTGGNANLPIGNAFPSHIVAEWAAGYSGIFSQYVCFESYAWQSYLYGQMGLSEGRWFDAVIPNFFDLDDWMLPATEKEDYLFFIGRLQRDKGVEVASEIAKRLGRELLVAGSGVKEIRNGDILTLDGALIKGEYVGLVGGKEREELMRKASVLLAPTIYVEPFGATVVEAQLCGTPVITTDWGAFSETVVNGLTGYRFRSLKEGMEAVKMAEKLNHVTIAEHARATYSLDAIGPLYDQWFKRLVSLHADGWYAT